MEIRIKVKTNAPKDSVTMKDDLYHIEVRESPEKGKANQAVIKLLSKYFKKPIKMVRGFKNKEKVLRIEG